MEVGPFLGNFVDPLVPCDSTSWLWTAILLVWLTGILVGYKLHGFEIWLRAALLSLCSRRVARRPLALPVKHWQRLGRKVRKEIALRVVRLALEKRHAVGSPQSSLLSPINRRPTTRRRLTVELPALGCVTLNK
jgi:hypothetical protein